MSRKKEVFEPEVAGKVGMYICGVTAYDFSHIGHARAYVTFDCLYRKSTVLEKIKEAHRRVMIANHPDAGGSHFLAMKINEAKDIMLGKTKNGGSDF